MRQNAIQKIKNQQKQNYYLPHHTIDSLDHSFPGFHCKTKVTNS